MKNNKINAHKHLLRDERYNKKLYVQNKQPSKPYFTNIGYMYLYSPNDF